MKKSDKNLQRTIFHCDCNSFFASVELLQYPELRAKPVAVSGSVDDRHGIILAKNEAAKRYNVQTAETVWQAKRKCPDLILLPPHRGQYKKYSRILNDIYEEYSDRVEPFGIDESWIDVTGSWQLFGESPKAVADALRKRIQDETGLTISVGVSFNKIFAKLGSDYKKPDATTVINKENYQEIVWKLPVTAMLYVGHRSQKLLEELGIKTIGALATADETLLAQVLGKQGRQLWLYARGEDDSPVARVGESEPVKSVGNGLTFRRNLVGIKDIRTGINSLADEVATRLRRHGLYAGGVQLVIKDKDLKSISRQKPLPFATNLSKDLARGAMELVRDNWDLKKPVRMLTVTATHLSDLPGAEQTSLFGDEPKLDKRQQKLENSIDAIRGKFGTTAILPAGVLHNDIGLDTKAKPEEEEEEPALE